MEGKAKQGPQGAQRVFSWDGGALPLGSSTGPSSWLVPGTSPTLLVYVESVLLTSDLMRAVMVALDIRVLSLMI